MYFTIYLYVLQSSYLNWAQRTLPDAPINDVPKETVFLLLSLYDEELAPGAPSPLPLRRISSYKLH